jgi:integrase
VIQQLAYSMLQRRARDAGLDTNICNHTFRATGIKTYLQNGGALERAAQIANHTSTVRSTARRHHAGRDREDTDLSDGGAPLIKSQSYTDIKGRANLHRAQPW